MSPHMSIFYLWCVLCDYLSLFLGVFFFLGGDGPVISICLCYACRCFSFLRSSLKSCYPVSFAYRVFDVWPPHRRRLLLRPRRTPHCFPHYLSILHAILALRLRRARGGGVISLPSPVLSSCVIFRGYLGVVVPALSHAAIKVVTSLRDSLLKRSQECLGGFF